MNIEFDLRFTIPLSFKRVNQLVTVNSPGVNGRGRVRMMMIADTEHRPGVRPDHSPHSSLLSPTSNGAGFIFKLCKYLRSPNEFPHILFIYYAAALKLG